MRATLTGTAEILAIICDRCRRTRYTLMLTEGALTPFSGAGWTRTADGHDLCSVCSASEK